MNRLQDDYDPYTVEEPSDEEPALSRWAPARPRPGGFGAVAWPQPSRFAVPARPARTLSGVVPKPVAPRCRLWGAEGSLGDVLQPRGRWAHTGAGKGAVLESRESSKAV